MSGFDVRAEVSEISEPLGESLGAAIGALMEDLGREFGESAEAWRGAGAISREMMQMMSYMLHQADRDGVSMESAGPMILAILASVFRTLIEHPAVKVAQ